MRTRSKLAEDFRVKREKAAGARGAYFLAIYKIIQDRGVPVNRITPDVMLQEMTSDHMAGATDKNELRSFLADPRVAEAWVRQWGDKAADDQGPPGEEKTAVKDWNLVAVWVNTAGQEQDEVLQECDTYLEAKQTLMSIGNFLGQRDQVAGLLKTIRIDGDYRREYLRGG